MRRLIALVLVGGVAASSFASFELLMVMDTGTKSIQRFDGDTGAYLGSFGGGSLFSPTAFAIDRATSHAYVNDGGAGLIRVFDYNTGSHLYDLSGGSIGYNNSMSVLPNGNLVFGYVVGGYNMITPTGSYAGSLTCNTVNGVAGVGMSSATHGPSGNVVGWTCSNAASSPGELQVMPLTGAAPVAVSGLFAGAAGFTVRSQVAMSGNNGFVVSPTGLCQMFSLNSAGNVLTTGASLNLAPTVTSVSGGIFGHGNTVYYAGQNASNVAQGRIMRGIYNSNSASGTFGENILVNPSQMAIVLAPEPGTWAALGLGALTLMRRRKR